MILTGTPHHTTKKKKKGLGEDYHLQDVSFREAFFSLILSFKNSASLRALTMRSAISELISIFDQVVVRSWRMLFFFLVPRQKVCLKRVLWGSFSQYKGGSIAIETKSGKRERKGW